MKVKSSIKSGAEYLCTKLGDVVTAVQQVAVVKGLAMWEVERKITESKIKAHEWQQRDTFVIHFDGKCYVVGREVKMEVGKNQELEQLDTDFVLSDGYTARVHLRLLYGCI